MSDRDQPHPRGVLIVGCGYSGKVIARQFVARGVPVWGTTRSKEGMAAIAATGATPLCFDAFKDTFEEGIAEGVDTVVDTAGPPWKGGEDPTEAVAAALRGFALERFIYLSSTGVYGDHGGEWVDEETPCAPDSPQGHARRRIEESLLVGPLSAKLPALVARLSGIYGPGRSLLHRIASGRFRWVGGGSRYTNRIHVEDLAAGVVALSGLGRVGRIYLLTDDEPCPMVKAAGYAAALLGMELPAPMDPETARQSLSPGSFAMLTESKRLRNTRMRVELGVVLQHPTYREGIAAIHRAEWGDS